MTATNLKLAIAVRTAELRELILELTPAQRVEVFSVVTAGYCTECGAADPSCRCWDDE